MDDTLLQPKIANQHFVSWIKLLGTTAVEVEYQVK